MAEQTPRVFIYTSNAIRPWQVFDINASTHPSQPCGKYITVLPLEIPSCQQLLVSLADDTPLSHVCFAATPDALHDIAFVVGTEFSDSDFRCSTNMGRALYGCNGHFTQFHCFFCHSNHIRSCPNSLSAGYLDMEQRTCRMLTGDNALMDVYGIG